MSNIGIIGAGIAGLTAAYELEKQGHRTTVFEKNTYPGGRTYTYRCDQTVLNTGAVFFVNFYTLLFEYLREFDLGEAHFEMNHDVNFMNGPNHHLYKFDNPAAIFSLPNVSLLSKLKFAWFGAKTQLSKSRYSLTDPSKLAALDEQSISDFVEEKFGRDMLQYFVRATTEPYFYWSTDEVSSSLFKTLSANMVGAKFHTFSDGMDSLAQALASRVDDIRYGMEIEGVDLVESEKVMLTFQNTSEEYDGLIVATTANVASKLTNHLSVINGEHKAFLGSQRYSSNVNTAFWVDRKFTKNMPTHNQPAGNFLVDLGAIVVQGERSEKMVARNNGMEKVVIYYLDKSSKQLLNRDDSDIAKMAFEALQRFFPHVTRYEKVIRVNRHPYAIPIPEPGRFKQARDFINSQQPPIVFAGDYLVTSNIDGAIQSGRLAAQCFKKGST